MLGWWLFCLCPAIRYLINKQLEVVEYPLGYPEANSLTSLHCVGSRALVLQKDAAVAAAKKVERKMLLHLN